MVGQWLTADEQRAWRAYLRAGALLRARLNRQLQADSGLSLPEYEVLVQLSEAPGGRLRPFQLGAALHWEQSRLSHLLSRMTRRGFVAKRECAGDARGAVAVLTAAGRAAIESAAPGHVAAVRQLVFDPLDSTVGAEVEQLAASHGVKLISYDRATFVGTNTYYVSFDNFKVGQLIGRGFEQCVTDWSVSSPQVFEL
ncbi:MAG TPA: MarR family transcriptional regulator, partial [Streptosporangiaceae bacterium]|nr:MarR family transcriptional regulator [Streptosporangiaceae bacterium]